MWRTHWGAPGPCRVETSLISTRPRTGNQASARVPTPGVSTFSRDTSGLPRTVLWDRRFRLSTSHVLPQKASTLSSRSQRGQFPLRHLASGWLDPGGSPATATGCHARICRPSLPRLRPRSRQSCFRASVVAGCSGGCHGSRRPPIRRDRTPFLSLVRLGYYAQPRACGPATQDPVTRDYALAERLHGAEGQPDTGPHWNSFPAR